MIRKLILAAALLLLPAAAQAQTYGTQEWGVDKTNPDYSLAIKDGTSWRPVMSVKSGTNVPIISFTQTGTGAVASTVEAKLKQTVSILDFGADPTGAADSTTAVNNAIATGKEVFVPKGNYKLTDTVTLQTGQRMFCENGPQVTTFSVDYATFNMSALGVIRLPFGTNSTLEGCGIVFTQPDPLQATFTADIAQDAAPALTGTLTVSAVASGTLAVGDVVFDNANSGTVGDGSTITSQVSGTPGGVGVYKVTIGQTVTSRELRTARKSVLKRYPPGIYMVGATYAHVRNIRVSSPWRCIEAAGNTGGSIMEDINCGGFDEYERIEFIGTASGTTLTVSSVTAGTIRTDYNLHWGALTSPGYRIVGQLSGTPGGAGTYQLNSSLTLASATTFRQATGNIAFDGALGFTEVSVQCWPFSYAGASDRAKYALYKNQKTNCMNIGRMDGLTVDRAMLFKSSLIVTQANIGGIPIIINKLSLDTDGADFIVRGGRVRVLSGYSTRSENSLTPPLIAENTGTEVTFTSFSFPVNNGRACSLEALSGSHIIFKGEFTTKTSADFPYVCAHGLLSGVTVHNSYFPVTTTNRTAAVFEATSTSWLRLRDNHVTEHGAATGDVLSIETDSANNYVSDNKFGGWTHNLPFTTSLGYYDLGEPDTCTFVPAFATPGDSTLTATATSCAYYRNGAYASVSASTTFDTNAYTTASGSLGVTGSFPAAVSGERGRCTFNDLQNVTTTAVQTTPWMQSSVVFFRQFVSNGAAAFFGPTNVPASKTGVVIAISCSYRVK